MQGSISRTTDPYARACGCNSGRSMAVDSGRTNPAGWETDKRPERTTEQIIYEMHIKDFSCDASSGVPEAFRGKYKAFTLEGTMLDGNKEQPTCLDYLKKLGVTHVQLMPVFDFGSIDEAGDGETYNWGYDPVNYNVPEGSYATDPYNGEVRMRELKELVLALHRHGIRVIMDVVYNHTYSLDSCFTKTAPGYFYRQFADGVYANGSACGNDLASEREMCGKYILESVLYWAEEYHMDGFRFDLMGLLDTELLNRIRRELDARFGKDEILLYGEPWRAAPSPMAEGFLPCLKENIHLLEDGVGIFCDNTRDAIKGHVFYEDVPGFVNGGRNLENEILHAVRAWTGGNGSFGAKAPSQIISYLSAHDNLTLWDKLMVTLFPDEAFDLRHEQAVRANKLAAAVCFTCQGRIFFLGGEEAARTKMGISNSYRSSAAINGIDWKRVYEYEDLVSYYRGLIAFRKQMPGLYDKSPDAGARVFKDAVAGEGFVWFLTDNRLYNREESKAGSQTAKKETAECTCKENCAAGNSMTGDCCLWDTLLICYNASDKEQNVTLPEGTWDILADGDSAWLWRHPAAAREKVCRIAPVCAKIFGRRSQE